jgi:glycine dehydrogenase
MLVTEAPDKSSVKKEQVKSMDPDHAAADTLAQLADFPSRHIGPGAEETRHMLELLGYSSLDALVADAVPAQIRLSRQLRLPEARSEHEVLAALKEIAAQNQVFRSFIGMGYSDCITPPVIQRNLLENPGWYTQYTPYQAEIAQGRLESLLNFQTMIIDLTGMEVANASLLDEGTAAAEAMSMCHGMKEERNVYLVSAQCHPQTIEVVRTRAQALGIQVSVSDHEAFRFDETVFGALFQYPDTYGAIHDYSGLIERGHAAGALITVAADLLSLTLLRPPGEFGADVALGSAQRFGVPLGYGGPHAAYFATREAFKRHMPGRIVGVSKDSRGHPAMRLALQTREQHIRREKATSNICTAQALLANIAAMYACYHGPKGLKRIAQRVHHLATVLAAGLEKLGNKVGPKLFFDTLRVDLGPKNADEIIKLAEAHHLNFRRIDQRTVGISLDETTTSRDVDDILRVFNGDRAPGLTPGELAAHVESDFEKPVARTSAFLTHPVFNRYHSETEMLRYLKRLETRDLSLTTSMIPLGSCTMKLNATVEMLPVTWPEFGRMHPFAPVGQTRGYQMLFRQLEEWLCEITGFAGISLQPNAGSQGEYAGLLVIRAYHVSRGQADRTVCLIPTSAHGTNPASAVMAGLRVVPVACDKGGNIDVADLGAKAETHKQDLAALMVTYPSTHGVFEETIQEICRIVHGAGGQVYMDGANLNAQVGLCRPGDMGADVCHLNLHKTFCIPHGGGGPGMGPIGVASHLIEFLPGHAVVKLNQKSSGAVSSAPWGSASILPISWVYIAAMGAAGLTAATQYAILNANYIARRLQNYFPVLYRGHAGLVAHECILDLRQFKSVTVEDVAKRLMDYGFHAPTISWPVPGTMMVEPTESESKEELDRFCDALLRIHAEIVAVESGQADRQNNPLKNAPHTADMLAIEPWGRAYSREQACFPAPWLREYKFWPAVGRIDNVFGDRNLVCSCVGMEAYTE